MWFMWATVVSTIGFHRHKINLVYGSRCWGSTQYCFTTKSPCIAILKSPCQTRNILNVHRLALLLHQDILVCENYKYMYANVNVMIDIFHSWISSGIWKLGSTVHSAIFCKYYCQFVSQDIIKSNRVPTPRVPNVVRDKEQQGAATMCNNIFVTECCHVWCLDDYGE